MTRNVETAMPEPDRLAAHLENAGPADGSAASAPPEAPLSAGCPAPGAAAGADPPFPGADAEGVFALPPSDFDGVDSFLHHAAPPENKAEDAPPPGEQGWSDLPPEPCEPDLVVLRSLLLKRELALLAQLKHRLDNPVAHARDVSSVIAEALLMRAGKDDKLTRSLEPMVEDIFKTALRKNPLDFANSLFPLMGPAIRRSIAETFRSMLESFNKSIEMAFSWKGLGWRLESLRTGKPFSEIVLLHTLVYRVEQLFLIHSDTGLVLAHEVSEGVISQDADLVSAMLTAIQDFVRDCFAAGREGELESLQLGEFTILVEKNPYAYLACVVRGTPPMGFRQKLRGNLELILVECFDALVHFTGDTSPFLFARRRLKDCMDARFVDEGKPLPLWVKALPVLVLLGLATAFGCWFYSESVALQAAEQARTAFYADMDGYVNRLREEPGIVVVTVLRSDTAPWPLVCLHDELARQPAEVLARAGAPADAFQITLIPHLSLEPAIVARRVEQKIRPPDGVAMRFDPSGTLYLSGTAPIDWILQARQDALLLPGVKQVDKSGISDPRMARIREMVDAVESVSILFPSAKDMPTPEDAPVLAQAVKTLVELEAMCRTMGLAVSLTVYGHTDATGTDKFNYALSQARAATLAAMLYAKGSSMPVSLYGMGAEYASKTDEASAREDAASRRIELRVHLTRSAESMGALF